MTLSSTSSETDKNVAKYVKCLEDSIEFIFNIIKTDKNVDIAAKEYRSIPEKNN